MLVSTIIPTYNRARQASIAIESALQQTYPADQHEIIVVDDGSTDDTAQVLARFGDRIRYLRKANGGVSSARNFGIEQARGEAIAFLDSDDGWRPEKLAAQVQVLRDRPEIALVLTDIMVIDRDRREVGPYSRRVHIPRDGWVLPFILRNPALTPSSALVRASVVRELGGFDSSLPTAEDLDFHLRVALKYQIAVVDRPLTLYMRSEEGLSADVRTYADYVFVIDRFVRLHEREVGARDGRQARFGAYTRNAFGLLHRGQLLGALRLGLRSVPLAREAKDVRVLGGLCFKFGRSAAGRVVRRVSGRAPA